MHSAPTILLVDDEPHVVRVLQLGLQDAGYVVRTAADGAAALQALKEQVPDALITDIQMPNVDGRQLCEHIAGWMPARRFPIYVVTSLAELDHREWSRAIPNVHLLEKPLGIRDMLARLAEDLGGTDQCLAS